MHNERVVIGITPSIDRGQRLRAGADYYYVRRAYAERIGALGGVSFVLTLDTPVEAAVELCHGFVISGGDDLPCLLGAPLASEAPEDAQRIEWELALLDRLAPLQKPVLGVCYGMQLINLHGGGSLYERVQAERPGCLDHGGLGKLTRHEISVMRPTRLLSELPERMVVNSSHRQAVARVAPGFNVTARSSDGVVEAIEGDAWFGVEWHPETDDTGAAVYKRFLELVREACLT